MKLVLYTDDYNILDVIENVENPVVKENNVDWNIGSLQNINVPFLLLEDDVDVSTISHATISQDKKSQFVKVNLEQEFKQLKKQQADFVFELMIKGVL